MNGNAEEDSLILSNLKDAGCDEVTIETYFQLQKAGKCQESFRLLSLHRASLLDQVHVNQRRIDCLDYLVYKIRKEQKQEDL